MRSRCSSLLYLLLSVAFGLTCASGQEIKPVTPAQDRLTGAWRLVSVETIRPNGEVIYPFYGKHPEGLIVYDRSGWMSVQIISDPKPATPTASSREEFMAATAAEKAAAVDGYYAYFGTWTIDQSTSTVTHHIKQSLYPGNVARTEPGTSSWTPTASL
jgi:hypothetical protein